MEAEKLRVHFFNPESTQPSLHLAHANGFPPETYQAMLLPIFPQFKVFSLYARPFWGDTNSNWLKSWSQLADDLIESLDGMNAKQIIGVGHSLGAVCTLYAAVKRPDLFSKIILIDPTMLPPKLLWQIKIMKLFGLDPRSYLIKGALRRKRNWENAKAAYDYFRGRRLFKNWSDEMVLAYTESITGLSPEGGVQLLYPPEWEAQIYRTIPTDVWKKAGKLSLPTLVIRGEDSNTFTARGEGAFQKANPTVFFASLPGAGHLVAQEKPLEVSRLVKEFLAR